MLWFFWNFFIYIFVSEMRSSIAKYCDIFCYISNALYYCGFSCYIFLRFSGTRSGIVVCFGWFFFVWNVFWYYWKLTLSFCVWKALWYWGILCNLVLDVERTLLLCNFVLYFYVCWRWCIIVQICVKCFCMRNILRYYEISCYIFLHVEHVLVWWNFMWLVYAWGKRSGIVEFMLYFNACGIHSSIV